MPRKTNWNTGISSLFIRFYHHFLFIIVSLARLWKYFNVLTKTICCTFNWCFKPEIGSYLFLLDPVEMSCARSKARDMSCVVRSKARDMSCVVRSEAEDRCLSTTGTRGTFLGGQNLCVCVSTAGAAPVGTLLFWGEKQSGLPGVGTSVWPWNCWLGLALMVDDYWCVKDNNKCF